MFAPLLLLLLCCCRLFCCWCRYPGTIHYTSNVLLRSFKILNALLAKSERFSFRDENQETPLHLAASSGIVENVAALVQLSAGLNERDDQGRAPLHKAVANGHR